MNEKFWSQLDELIIANGMTAERPKGSAHPRYPKYIYPLDCGFINNTKSSDGAEIDVWIGSDTSALVTGALMTFDPVKDDVEIKVLIDCTSEEMQLALAASNRGDMGAVLLSR